jgi:hypothetical protein
MGRHNRCFGELGDLYGQICDGRVGFKTRFYVVLDELTRTQPLHPLAEDRRRQWGCESVPPRG